MNERAAELIVKAVTDAVRDALPAMIETALAPFAARLAACELTADSAGRAIDANTKATQEALRSVDERVAHMAREQIEFCDSSIRREIEALDERVRTVIKPVGEQLVHLGDRIAETAAPAAQVRAIDERLSGLDQRLTITTTEVFGEIKRGLDALDERTRAALDAQLALLPEQIAGVLTPIERRVDRIDIAVQEAGNRLNAHAGLMQTLDEQIRDEIASVQEELPARISAGVTLPLAELATKLDAADQRWLQREQTRQGDVDRRLDACEASQRALGEQLPGKVGELLARDVHLALDEAIAPITERLDAHDVANKAGARCDMDLDRRLAACEARCEAIEGGVPERITEAVGPLAERLLQTSDALADAISEAGAQVKGIDERMTHLAREVIEFADEQIALKVAQLPKPEPGPAGPPGEPGRDGVFLGPVAWAPGGTVKRGTLVSHRGGLWAANVDTLIEPGAPSCGYTLLVDGMLPECVEQDEEGNLQLVYAHASGLRTRVAMGLRPMTWQGVYDATTTYLRPDVVTCEGSLWVARSRTQGDRPGTDGGAQAWALIVKRGRDGRDGQNGADGKDGKPGAPGPRGEGFKFCGQYRPDDAYKRGDVVLVGEALYCIEADAPAGQSPSWQVFLPALAKRRKNGAQPGA